MARRKKRELEPAQRVRHLLSLDALNVMTRLAARRHEMVGLFSRLRDRAPLLSPLDSWFESISFTELALLEPAEQKAVNHFHELLGEVRWYLRYTEDMPTQVQHKLTQFVHRLETSYRKLVTAIGPPDAGGAPVIEVEVRKA